MADKKLAAKITSPGEAWNNFVNSKEGHNAAAVTPAYVDFNNKAEKKNMPDIHYIVYNPGADGQGNQQKIQGMDKQK